MVVILSYGARRCQGRLWDLDGTSSSATTRISSPTWRDATSRTDRGQHPGRASTLWALRQVTI